MLWHVFKFIVFFFFVNACVSRTLIQGDKKAGFTVFWADDGLDTGPILLQRECAVEPNDTVDTLYNRFLFPEGIKAMVTTNFSISRGIGNILSSDPPSSQDLLTHIFILLPIMPSSHSAACIFWDCQQHKLHRLRCHTQHSPGAGGVGAAHRWWEGPSSSTDRGRSELRRHSEEIQRQGERSHSTQLPEVRHCIIFIFIWS